jgi:hypothetical protein
LDSGFTGTGRALERVIGLIKEAAEQQKRYGPAGEWREDDRADH